MIYISDENARVFALLQASSKCVRCAKFESESAVLLYGKYRVISISIHEMHPNRRFLFETPCSPVLLLMLRSITTPWRISQRVQITTHLHQSFATVYVV